MTHPSPSPSPSSQLLTAIWNLWQSLAADGAARLREECGLDLREFIAAGHLRSSPAHPAQLAADLQMPRYEVSRLLRGMEDKGFVQRTRERSDGRQVLVQLTPSGLNAWQIGYRTAEQVTEPYLAGLDDTRRQDLVATLASLTPPTTRKIP